MSKRVVTLAAIASVSVVSAASGAVVISYAEAPGDQVSQVPNTSVFDFNSLSVGVHDNVTWAGVGTYDKLSILAADEFGGAYSGTGTANTNYSVQSASANLGAVKKTTLTLNAPHAYFGLWWSAGDNENVMDFYNGSTLVAHFTTATLPAKLPKTYFGNPTAAFIGQDKTEPFAFLNFFGANGTTWNKIVFTNSGSSGFESDNHTDRVDPVTGPLPGIVFASVDGNVIQYVPEPATLGCMFAASAMLLVRKRQKQA